MVGTCTDFRFRTGVPVLALRPHGSLAKSLEMNRSDQIPSGCPAISSGRGQRKSYIFATPRTNVLPIVWRTCASRPSGSRFLPCSRGSLHRCQSTSPGYEHNLPCKRMVRECPNFPFTFSCAQGGFIILAVLADAWNVVRGREQRAQEFWYGSQPHLPWPPESASKGNEIDATPRGMWLCCC